MGNKGFEADVGEIYQCGTWFAGQVDDVDLIASGAKKEGANAEGFDCALLKPIAEAMPEMRELIDQAFDSLLRERVENFGQTLQAVARQYANTDKEKADLLDAVVKETPSGTHNGPGF